jgi:hypothetical protein
MSEAYRTGFYAKCAEAGIDPMLADVLYKAAENGDPNIARATEIFKDYLTNRRVCVRNGETLSGIASRNGKSLQEVMEANGMSSPYVKPGQVLKIPLMSVGKAGRDAT